MDTFCGCDTETLDDLAERVREGALRLIQLIELLREAAESVDWTGPDADAHRHRTATMAEHGLAAGADLRAKALELRRHAWEQERASELDPGAAVRAELPGDRGGKEIFEEPGRWIGGPMAPADPLDPAPGLRGLRGLPTPPGGWGPWIGGPMAPADPTSPVPSLPTPPGGWGPWSGGPFMPSPPPPVVSGPLPEGEQFALDPEIVAEARGDRELALGSVPVAGHIQTALGLHEELGHLNDRLDEAAGGTVFEPLARVARVPHTVTEPVLGEGSTAGQLAGVLDRSWANVLQTGSEVTAAVGEGDLAAAARAGERGLYRSAENSADLLTITPIPAYAETGADLLGEGADAVRGISPEAAAALESAEATVREDVEGLTDFRETLTDGETWYDARRRYAPMPWDPQG